MEEELKRGEGEVAGRDSMIKHLEGIEWEVILVQDSQVNMYCLPGGKTVVNSGLLGRFEHEDEVDTVIGHEVCHFYFIYFSQIYRLKGFQLHLFWNHIIYTLHILSTPCILWKKMAFGKSARYLNFVISFYIDFEWWLHYHMVCDLVKWRTEIHVPLKSKK